MEILVKSPPDYYWATEEDPVALAGFIRQKSSDYWKHIKRSGLANRISRSWRYYHNLFYEEGEGIGGLGREIRQLGEKGELAGLALNHTRNLLQHLLTLATQNPPAYDVLAINTDTSALRQAKLGNQLLDYYHFVEGISNHYKRAVETALVMTAGYVSTVWNARSGPKALSNQSIPSASMAGAGGTLGPIFEPLGDLEWHSPRFQDVSYDPRQPDWDKQRWVAIETHENRWELAEQNPELRDEIASWSPDRSDPDREWHGIDPIEDDWSQDIVPVTNWYHVATDAIAEGRYARCLGDLTLFTSPMPYEDLPIDRVVTGEFLGTCHGYTPAFDLQGLQEALNGEVSTILTNHKSFGVQTLWTPTTSNVGIRQIRDYLLMIESDVEPKALNLTATPPELFQFISVIMQHMEYISGINSVLRGQPEANLKSGRALALIAAQAVQFASPLIQSYNRLLESNGTKAIRILRQFLDAPRVIALVGKVRKSHVLEFSKEDLVLIDRVKVQSGNAMTRTLAGRIEIADRLLDKGMLRNRDEYLTVMETGQLDALTEFDDAQLNVVRDENERIREGNPHRALALDYHVLHIREHFSVLNSTAMRSDPTAAAGVLAAVMEHVMLLLNPMIQIFQTILGYPTQVPPLPGVPLPGQQPQPPGEPGAPAGPTNPLDRPPPEAPEAQAVAQPFTQAGEV